VSVGAGGAGEVVSVGAAAETTTPPAPVPFPGMAGKANIPGWKAVVIFNGFAVWAMAA